MSHVVFEFSNNSTDEYRRKTTKKEVFLESSHKILRRAVKRTTAKNCASWTTDVAFSHALCLATGALTAAISASFESSSSAAHFSAPRKLSRMYVMLGFLTRLSRQLIGRTSRHGEAHCCHFSLYSPSL